jgi:hypothetical protein
VVAGLLRDSVVLCRALGRFCNGHPASVVVKNQRLPNFKISEFSVPSSFEPGGRRFESVRARFSIKVLPGDRYPVMREDKMDTVESVRNNFIKGPPTVYFVWPDHRRRLWLRVSDLDSATVIA